MTKEYANFQVDRFYVYYCGRPLGVEGSQTRYKCPISSTKTRDIYVSSSGQWHCKHAKCAVESNCKITGGGPKQFLEMAEPTMSDKEAFDTLDTFGRNSTSTSTTKSATTKKPSKNWKSLEDISNWLSSKPPRGRGYSNVITHEYQKANGSPCMAVIRCEPGKDKKKDFFQYHKTATGWEAGGIKDKRPLYRLSVLANGMDLPVIICEGEKKADILQKALPNLSYWVTSPPQGAQSPNKSNWEPVKGRPVFILPDNDKPGISFAKKVSTLCLEAGATSTAIVRPFYSKKENDSRDIADFLADGGTTEAIIKELQGATSGVKSSSEERKPQKNILNTFSAFDLQSKEFAPIRWVVPNILAEGYALLGGRPKRGKSWLALGLSLAVASGGVVFGKVKVEQGEVLYLALEDNGRRLQNRLQKLSEPGKPLPKGLHFITELPNLKEGGAEAIQSWLQAHPETRLLVVDTINHPTFVPSRNKGADVAQEDYKFGHWIQKLAIKNNLCVLGLIHTKKVESEYAIDNISGSTGITAPIDTAMVFGQATKGKATAILHITGRDVPAQELALDFKDSTWSLLGNAEDFEVTDERKQIIDLLRTNGPMYPKEIADNIGSMPNTARQLLLRMRRSGLITQIGGARSKYALPNGVQTELPLSLNDDGELI